MQFKDTMTGAKIDVVDDIVIEQLKKYPDRYKEVKIEPKKAEEKK